MSNIVPTNQPSVYLGLDKLSTLEKNSVVRPNNPPPGIAGFLFDIPLDDSIQIESDITDNYVEDNTAIQDQIALKPEIVTVRGLVGELVQTQDQIDNVNAQPDLLPLNPDLEPEYTEIQQIEFADDEATATQEVSSQTDSKSLDNYFEARTPITTGKQTKAFAYFYQLWKGRQLMTVDTPWGFFTDMVIQSLRVSQDSASKMESDFTLTFKKMRFAQEVAIVSGQLAGRCALQSTSQTNNGVAGKDPVTTSKNQSWIMQLTQ
jgi:hypothetical protein